MNAVETPFRIAFSAAPARPTFTLAAGHHFRLYPIGINADLSERLPARLIDLIRLGLAVHVVDGLISRSGCKAGYRTPVLEVEVWDTTFWKDPLVGRTIKSCLDFLSGDDNWQISFLSERAPVPEYQRHFFSEPSTVFLHSGGLDSVAGLAARIRECQKHTFIPVTVRYQLTRGRLVRKQFELIKRRYKIGDSRLLPLLVAAFVRNRRIFQELKLRTRGSCHRCRSFLLMILGGVAAAVEGADCLEVYESGIGAVNLPLQGQIIGWRTTRNTHPYFLRMMSELLTLVVERPITIKLPFIHQTKAEIVAMLAQEGLEDLARLSTSCIVHPLRRPGLKPCGTCAACIYRRYALQSARIEEAPGTYHEDIFGLREQFKTIPERKLSALKAFLAQATQLEHLQAGIATPQWFRQHLLRTRVVESEPAIDQFIDIFSRYGKEWKALVALGQERGWPWANWFAPLESNFQEGINRASA